MKNCKIIFWGLLMMGLFCLLACDKYNSKITGKVYYIDENYNISLPAAGAVVTKMIQKGDSLHSVVAVFANENGEFLFDHTTKGTWILSGKLEIEIENDTTTHFYYYYGQSESFTTSGEDQVEQTLSLKLIPQNDTE